VSWTKHSGCIPIPPQSRHAFTVEKLLREGVSFFVARIGAEAAACGGLKIFGSDYGEVKRMYVRPAYRGRGLGKAVLNTWQHTLRRAAG
jgi:GNAT superfamily N-acetyltransferase